jgi:uncharacterized protein YjbJ (UPF0337 family)
MDKDRVEGKAKDIAGRVERQVGDRLVSGPTTLKLR